jgi:hypothetical protein
MSDAADSPSLYTGLVRELLDAEEKRRDSLEARGASVITVSGALVTLLFGLAAVVTGAKGFHVSGAVRDRLGWAAIAFVVAAVLAVGTYAPQPTRMTDPHKLAELLPDLWNRDLDHARKTATNTRLDQLAVAQRANDIKGLLLAGAIAAQVIAVLLVAWAVLGIL